MGKKDPNMIRTSTHVARKKHICDGCLKPIMPGTTYIREVYKNAEYLMNQAVHLHCKRAEVLTGWDGWYCAFSGEKWRACGFAANDKAMVAEKDQDTFIAIWGAG